MSESGWGSIIIYLFVVGPATRSLIQRSPGRKGIVHAVAFLGLIAAFTTYTGYIQGKPESYYSLLETPVSSTQQQVKKAFRTVSVKYHPDKVSSLSEAERIAASERFLKISEAYDILSDASARKVYNKFGGESAKSSRKANAEDFYTTTMIGMGIHYVMMGLMTFLLTLGAGSGNARTYAYTGLIMMGIAEWQMRFTDFDILTEVFVYTPSFEKISILRQLYPAFMQGSKLIASIAYVDQQALVTQKLDFLVAHVADLHKRFAALEGKRVSSSSRGDKGKATTGDNAKPTQDNGGDLSTGNVDNLKKRQLQGKRKNAPPGASKRPPVGNTPARSGFSIPSWAWYLGIYFFINWVLK